jgi:hypothetical protein
LALRRIEKPVEGLSYLFYVGSEDNVSGLNMAKSDGLLIDILPTLRDNDNGKQSYKELAGETKRNALCGKIHLHSN